MSENWRTRLTCHTEKQVKLLGQFFGVGSDTNVINIKHITASAGRCSHQAGSASSERDQDKVELHVSKIPEDEVFLNGDIGVILLGCTSSGHPLTVKFGLTEAEAVSFAKALLNATSDR